MIVYLKILYFINQQPQIVYIKFTTSCTAKIYSQSVTNKPLQIHYLRSFVSAFAAEAVVSWAWQIFALLGYLDWTSRTAIDECISRLAQKYAKRLTSFYKISTIYPSACIMNREQVQTVMQSNCDKVVEKIFIIINSVETI